MRADLKRLKRLEGLVRVAGVTKRSILRRSLILRLRLNRTACEPFGEKAAKARLSESRATLSPVRFARDTCRIGAISGDFQWNAGEFLCNPDCVAEREGFYYRRYLQVPVNLTLLR